VCLSACGVAQSISFDDPSPLISRKAANMDKLIPILIQLIGGGAGGNIIAAALKNLDLSKVIATITGVLGGLGGGQLAEVLGILEKIVGSSAGGQYAGQAGASAIGGALLTAIVGFIKKAMEAKGGA
jgi:hypothetical protein